MNCTDPSRPYCDLTGQYDPEGIKNSCVSTPFDAGEDVDVVSFIAARGDSAGAVAHDFSRAATFVIVAVDCAAHGSRANADPREA